MVLYNMNKSVQTAMSTLEFIQMIHQLFNIGKKLLHQESYGTEQYPPQELPLLALVESDSRSLLF